MTEISIGHLKELPEEPKSLMLYIMPLTMNWSEPKLLLKKLLSKLMLPHSNNGIFNTTTLISKSDKPKKEKLLLKKLKSKDPNTLLPL